MSLRSDLASVGPASGGDSGPASGGDAGPASGGASRPASSGASRPARGGVGSNAFLRKVNSLVKAATAAIECRPNAKCPLTKAALDKLVVAMESEFKVHRRDKRAMRAVNLDGSVSQHRGASKKKRRRGPSTAKIKALQKKLIRREEKLTSLQAELTLETTAKGRGGADHCRVVGAVRFGGPHRVIAFVGAQFQGHPGARRGGGEPVDRQSSPRRPRRDLEG